MSIIKSLLEKSHEKKEYIPVRTFRERQKGGNASAAQGGSSLFGPFGHSFVVEN